MSGDAVGRIGATWKATEYEMVSTLHAAGVTVVFHVDGRVTGRHDLKPGEAGQAILDLGGKMILPGGPG